MSTARETPPLDASSAEWLQEVGWSPDSIEPLTGDVSPRRYYRLLFPLDESVILAVYPESAIEVCRRFVRSSALLEGQGVPVPEILAVDADRGFMLLRDLGDASLYERRERGWTYLTLHLERAATLIPTIASLPVEEVDRLNPPLDGALLTAELRGTWELGLGVASLGAYGLPDALDAAVASMIERLDRGPAVPCHRDYMARNLVPSPPAENEAADDERGEVYVIDHQDLRLGPRTYDLASLLNDSLFAPRELEESLLERCLVSPDERADYHRASAQRSLKIVGTYLGFAKRGTPRHLPLVDPSLDRARYHLGRLPELAGLNAAVEDLAQALSAAAGRIGRSG